jgi:hypothetical protein
MEAPLIFRSLQGKLLAPALKFSTWVKTEIAQPEWNGSSLFNSEDATAASARVAIQALDTAMNSTPVPPACA